MPDIDLAAIKARADAATPGPWEAGDRYHVQGASHCVCAERYGPLVYEGRLDINGTKMPAHVHRAEKPWHPYGVKAAPRGNPVDVVVESTEYGTMTSEDREFIAAARTDVPALLAEVERLTHLLGSHADGHRCTCTMLTRARPDSAV